jgi:hypothetical protein
MNALGRLAIAFAISIVCVSNAQAQADFGVSASGSDLEPVSASLSDGGEGSSFASVSFTTFRVEASFDPASTYLPILKAESDGIGALFDDDRTNTSAEAYEVFTSSVAQTIELDLSLSSVVTNDPMGTSSVLANIYVIGGPGFFVSDTFCSPGERTVDGNYLCGARIATSTLIPGLSWSNLFNGGSNPQLNDTLTFTVAAGENFGIHAELSAGSYRGTADAFDTLTMGFDDDTNIAPVTQPAGPPAPVPSIHPIALYALVPGLLAGAGLMAMRRRR